MLIKLKLPYQVIFVAIILVVTIGIHMTSKQIQINESSILYFCLWGSFCYCLCLLSVRKVSGRVNYAYFWIICSILFFYSQYICYALKLDMSVIPRYINIFAAGIDSQSIVFGFFFPLECILIISLSYCLRYSYDIKKLSNLSEIEAKDYKYELNALRLVSRIILYITLIPTAYYCVFAIISNRLYGYTQMKYMLGEGLGRGSFLHFSVLLSGWFEPACYMLCVSTDNKYERVLVRFFLIIYAIGILMAGSRYRALEILCGYILIDYFWFNKTNKKRLIIYIFLGVFVIVAFSAVRFFRVGHYQAMEYALFSKRMVVDSLLGDSAATGRINCAVHQYTISGNEYGYGISFFYGIMALLPSFLRNIFFSSLQMDITGNLLSEFSGTTINSLGSSFCAEGFYNFGWLSFILMLFYGALLSRMTAIQDSVFKKMSPYKFILYVYISTQMIFCIRSEVSSIIRPTVYYVIFPIIISSIISSNIKKMSNSRNR